MKVKRSNLVKRKTRVKVKNAVKSTYNGVSFDSLLELFTYKALKEAGIHDFGRETWTVNLIDSFKFSGIAVHSGLVRKSKSSSSKRKEYTMKVVTPKIQAMTYTPDFVSINPITKVGWVIECKGWKTELSPIKRKLFKKYLTDNGYKVDYFEPNVQETVLETVKLIKKKYYGL